MKEIKIDGKTYLLDAEKAISAGFLKEKITLKEGDVYIFPDKGNKNKIILLRNWTLYNDNSGWYFGGNYSSLAPWSTKTDSTESTIDYIRSNGLIFVGNVNKAIFEEIQKMCYSRSKEN